MEQFIKLSAADKAAFELNGYVIVKSLYTKNEIDLLIGITMGLHTGDAGFKQ
ncbi:hypothetical protein [Agriterribacter sp.]|uniref:hypothetical protein n=1 Tax=Agriterribacter sp. TaxID=2821509 RepID=UPI002BEBF809|nr:hypothetical protein [Agriterribacter sp.]HRP56412.1 hypothetical protein [Agriterribacter sp.]